MTLNGEHGARAMRTIAPNDRSWWRCTASSLAARISSSSATTSSGGSPPSFSRQRHRAARRVEPHAEVAGRVDLGAEQVAGAAGVQVEVVGRRRAPAERQLGQPDPRRQVGGLGVERPPQRVQRLQPAEQRLVRHRRVGPGQVLEHVVVGVDQPRRDEAVGGVDDRPRRRVRAVPDGADEPVGDGDPAAGDLPPLAVHRGDAAGVGDDEIGAVGERRPVGRWTVRYSTVRSRVSTRVRHTWPGLPPGWRRWPRGPRRSSAG